MGLVSLVMCGCGASSTTQNSEPASNQPNDRGGVTNVDEKIIGKWELTTAGGQSAGSVWEFTKNKALLIPVESGGQTVVLQGSYQVAGPNVIITRQSPGGKSEPETHSVKVMTEDKMVLGQGSHEMHFKRKK